MQLDDMSPRQARAERMNRERNERVLSAALDIALTEGYAAISQRKVAQRASVSVGAVNYSFGNMAGLQDAVMREAIHRRHLTVLAQGLALRSRIALDAPEDLKRDALATLKT